MTDPAPSLVEPKRPSLRAAIAIILGNLIPVFGVLVLGWSVGQVLVLYWIETVVIGVLTIPRILSAQGPAMERRVFSGIPMAMRVVIAAFFVVHFGLFCAVQGFFAALLSAMSQTSVVSAHVNDPTILIRWMLADWNLRIGAAAIAVVQVYLFWREWVASGLWRTSEPALEMGRPYGRIFVMQFAIILGVFVMVAFNLPAGSVLILCIGKTLIELFPPGFGKRPGEP